MERLSVVFGSELPELRHLLLARPTPRSEEIQEYDLSIWFEDHVTIWKLVASDDRRER
jgi:hypothetical protein